MDKPPLIRRVVIHNYKSIAKCDVTLGRFNVFVGRNGAGKSNFLDALQFVADALSPGSLSHALESRGGIRGVFNRRESYPRSFRIELDIQLPGKYARYSVEVASKKRGFWVEEESLWVEDALSGDVIDVLICKAGKVEFSTYEKLSEYEYAEDLLLLPIPASIPLFRTICDALSAIDRYQPTPDQIRMPHRIEPEAALNENGRNIASVISRLAREQPATWTRVVEYLSQIVPGLIEVKPLEFSGYGFLEFVQQVHGESLPRTFDSQNMSDGTLRSLAVLVAALQHLGQRDSSHVIGIEEPETGLHPAAMAVLLDALREASVNTQILITTHSPDLLDRLDIETDSLFAVSDESGGTVIATIDRASASAIRDHLYTPGELLRMDQLEPRIDRPVEETSPL